MPFRPLTDVEKLGVLGRIDKVREEIEIIRAYLATLERRLVEGVWFVDPDEAKSCWEYVDAIARKDRLGE